PVTTENTTLGTAVIDYNDYPTDPAVQWHIAAPEWVSGKKYRIRAYAADRVTTPNYENPRSTRTCTVDIMPPSSKVTWPVEGDRFNASGNALTTLSGTATDDLPDNVQYTRVRISYSGAGTYYWNGSGWQVNVSSWLYTQNLTSGGTQWIFVFGDPSNWVSGKTYSVNAVATDKANNTELAFSTKTFQVDSQAPTTKVSIPAGGVTYRTLDAVTGTANDDFTGVDTIQVLLQDLNTGEFWNGGSWTNIAGDYWQNYTGGTISTWTYGAPDIAPPSAALTSGRRYVISSRGRDSAGNVGSSFSVGVNSNTFSWDVTAPTSTVTSLAHLGSYSSLLTLSGAMADVSPFAGAVISTVTVVRISLRDIARGATYWDDGTQSWIDSEQWNETTVHQSSWTFTFAVPSNLPWQTGRQYRIRSRAIDTALPGGNDQETQFPQGGYLITYDTTTPQAFIQKPANPGYYGGAETALPVISGTAADFPAAPLVKSDINNVRLQVRSGSDYWNGAAWLVSQSTWVPAQYNAGTWQYPGTLPGHAIAPWNDQAQYTVVAEAFDKAGNTSGQQTYTLTYDTSAPASGITYPASAFISASLTTLSGTANDPHTVRSDLKDTSVAIRLSGGNWYDWDAQSFTLSEASWTRVDAGGTFSQNNWTHSWHLPDWQTDTAYVVFSSATDRSLNNQVAVSSFTFSFDTTKSTSVVTVPSGAALYLSSLPTISGTAFDGTSNVSQTKVAIRWVTPDSYYTGAGWGASGVMQWRAAEGTASWVYPKAPDLIPNWTSGATYQIIPWTLDFAGNESTGTPRSFVFDNVRPTSTITLPLNARYYRALPTVSGTSFDQTSGVNGVNIYFKDNINGKYYGWTGSELDFALDNPTPLTPAGIASWTYAGFASKLTNGHAYAVVSRSWDKSLPQNDETAYNVGVNTSTFTYDVGLPTATIVVPSLAFNNGLDTISGTANDDLSGVNGVEIAIRDLTQGTTWFNGSGWISQPAEYWISVTTVPGSPVQWSYSKTFNWTPSREYRVTVRAKDNAIDAAVPGNPNVQSPEATRSFIYDVEKPTAQVTYPNIATINFIPTITGTAWDYPAGVNRVHAAIREESPLGGWWNPQTSTFSASLPQYSTATWLGSRWEWTAPPLRDGYRYLVQARAVDEAGNFGDIIPANSLLFRYDSTRPQAGITVPRDSQWYNGLATVSGTAGDTYGIAQVKVTYQKSPPIGSWWDGNGFTQTEAGAQWENATPSGSDWWRTPVPGWENGAQYKVVAKVYDNAGNEIAQPYPYSTFNYDAVPPTSTVTSPLSGAYYSSVAQISGEHYDANSTVGRVEIRLVEKDSQGAGVLRSWYGAQGWQATSVSSWVVVNAVYPSSWSYTAPVAYSDGRRYEFASRAWDVAGSSEVAGQVPSNDIWFIYDFLKPQSRVNLPQDTKYYASLTALTGTSSDNPAEPDGSGIADNAGQIAAQDRSVAGPNNWWDGVSAFGSAQQWFTAAGYSSWNYSFNNARWTDGHTYLVLFKATDRSTPPNTEDVFTVGVNSVTFTCDKSTPTSKVDYPSDRAVMNSLPTLSGTAVDTLVSGNASGIQKTEIAVRNEVSGLWWNGADFSLSQALPNFVPVTYQLSPSNTFWYFTDSGFTSQLASHSTYTIFSRAFDNAWLNGAQTGNYQTAYSSAMFVYDTTRPTSTIVNISEFMKSLSTVSGTSADAFGVSSVAVLIRDVTQGATYWNGTAWQDSVPGTWPPAAFAGNYWVFTSTPNWADRHEYYLWSKASDVSGNDELSGPPAVPQTSFKYDITRPESRVEYPQDAGFYQNLTMLSGTAGDLPMGAANRSLIKTVKVIIKCVLDNGVSGRQGKYFNGATWDTNPFELDATLVDIGGGVKRWSRGGALLPAWLDNEQYRIQCKAYDNADNQEKDLYTDLHAGSTWRCDTSNPVSYNIDPVESLIDPPNRYYNSLATVSGTAEDSYPLRSVEIRIWDAFSTRWWKNSINNWDDANPSPLSADAAWFTYPAMNTSGDWTLWQATFTVWTSGDKYIVYSRARDNAGNYSAVYSTSVFRYDTTKPETYVFQPADRSFISSLATISGTARDLPTAVGNRGPSGLTYVKLAVRNNATMKWWDGAGFSQDAIWPLTPGGLSAWGYDGITGSSLESGTSYYVTARSWDAALNIEDWYSVRGATFTFDNLGPEVAISSPVDGGYYPMGGLTSISGTAMDPTAGMQKVQLNIVNLTDGTTWFDSGAVKDWVAPGEYWVDVPTQAPGGVSVNWKYDPAELTWQDGRYYRVRSRAYDQITNLSTVFSTSTFLYDTTRPTSTVTRAIKPDNSEVTPLNNQYIENVKYIRGIAGDAASPFSNSGIPAGGVEYCLIMESTSTENNVPDTGNDYIWVGSTWTVYTGALTWRPATGSLSWYSEDMTGKWYSGRWYLVKSRSYDQAGNVQDDTLADWVRFSVSLPASNLALSFVDPPAQIRAGDTLKVRVEAKDTNGQLARNYQGKIRFTVDAPLTAPVGPEYPHTGGAYQPEQGWLPADYQFVTLNQGVKVFDLLVTTETLSFAKAGTRVLRATDINTPAITGQYNVTVAPAAPKKLRVLAPGVSRAPGVVGGVANGPVSKVAGASFDVTVDACDQYWNVVPSTSALIRLAIDPRSSPALPAAYESPSTQDKELTDAAALPQGTTTFAVTLFSQGNRTLSASVSGGGTSWTSHTTPQPIPVTAATAETLQVLVPGETAREGRQPYYPSGIGGKEAAVAVSTQVAGVPFDVTVIATDRYWNKVTGSNPWVDVLNTDKYAVQPSSRQLVNGTINFNLTLITGNLASGTTRYAVTYASATTASLPTLSAVSSIGIPVKPGPASSLLVFTPGETHEPGKTAAPAGKLGAPDALTAGTTHTMTVFLADSYGNFTSSSTGSMPVVSVWTDDPNDLYDAPPPGAGTQLIAGRAAFDIWFKTANDAPLTSDAWTAYAMDNDGTGLDYGTANTQNITVDANTPTRVLVLVPGETHQPGTAEGKFSMAQSTVAGTNYIVTVKACDDYWNRNKTAQANDRMIVVRTPDDANDTEPQNTLSDGQWIFNNVLLKTVGLTGSKSHRIIAEDVSGYAQKWTSGTIGGGGTMTLYPNNPSRLSLVVQGETEAPGTAAGKTGTPVEPETGQSFWVRVNVCDNYYNRALQQAPTVQVRTPDDPYDAEDSTRESWLNDGIGGYKSFTLNLRLASTQQIQVADTDGVSPLFTTTSTVINVRSKPATQLLLLFPGEQFRPGKTTGSIRGKDDAAMPAVQVAGQEFIVTALPVDQYWNRASTNTTVWIETYDDAYDAEPAPKTLVDVSTFSVTLYKRSGLSRIRLTDGVGIGLSDYDHGGTYRSYVSVDPADPSRVLALAPGETLQEGKYNQQPYGKSGAPAAQVAAVDFDLTIYFVDQYYNKAGILYDQVVSPPPVSFTLTSTDPNDTPAPFNGYEGIANQAVFTSQSIDNATGFSTPWKLITSTGTAAQPGTGWKITCAPQGYAGSDTQGIIVSTNVTMGAKLLVLMPNQSFAPGTLTGKTGTVAAQVAGSTYTVTVRSCDSYWNQTNDVPVVSVQTYDQFDDESSLLNRALSAGSREFVLRHYTATDSAWVGATYVNGSSAFNIDYSSYTTPGFTVQPSSATQLQVVISPDEAEWPGNWSGSPNAAAPYGRTGAITTKTAGASFTVRVNGVDQYWNRVTGAAADVRMASTDPNDTEPPGVQSLVGGTTSFIWTLISATTSGWTIGSSDEKPVGVKLSSSTSSLVKVNAAAVSKVLVLVPDETLVQGSSSGRAGTAAAQTAGQSFNVSVYAVDNYNNQRNDVSGTNVYLMTNDPYDVHPATQVFISGTTTFAHTFVTATDPVNRATHPGAPQNSWRVDAFGAGLASGSSSLIPVQPAPVQRLQVLVSPETARAGKPPYINDTGGKEGAPTAKTAGAPFNVTINASDYYWNVVSVAAPAADVTTTDPNGAVVASKPLANGTTSFSLTFITRSDAGWTISASALGYASFTSPNITVNPNTSTRLLVLLPNQSEEWGTASGRSGTPAEQTAGAAFRVTVNSCDDYFNFQPADTSSVSVTTSDLYDVHPATRQLITGTTHFWVTLVTAGSGRLVTARDISAPYMADNVSDALTVNAGTAVKLQVLLPGENPVPGSSSGKAGGASAQTAGQAFTVTVNAVDVNWNPASDSSLVRLDTSDAWDIHPATVALQGGTTMFTAVLVTAGSNHTLSAVDTEAPYLASNVSSLLAVNPDIGDRLQMLVPGETAAPGKWNNGVNAAPYGKSGAPTLRTAGVAFAATVNLTDDYWNIVSSAVTAGFTATDSYATVPSSQPLVNGTRTFSVTLVTSGLDPATPNQWTITAADVDGTNPLYTPSTSPSITVGPNSLRKLLVIVPGETAAPGKTGGSQPGKLDSSSPDTRTAGVTFNAEVYGCDDWWNVVNDATSITLTTSDTNDTEPAPGQPLVNGKKTLATTLVTSTTTGWTLSASGSAYTSYTTPLIRVNPAPATRLLALVPNETHRPGTATGKSGTVAAQTAGAPFTITALITDDRWNLVASSTAKVGVVTEDPYDMHPDSVSTTGGVVTFGIEFHRGVGDAYRITVSTADGETLSSYVTPPVTSNFGPAAKLQILLPGESAVDGSATGKTGTPDEWTADSLNVVTVRVVDTYWNRTNTTNTTVKLAATDPYYAAPANAPTSSGQATLLTSLFTKTTTGWTITVSTATGDNLQSNISAGVKVKPAQARQLLVLVPGETNVPGSPTGKSGTPAVQTAGRGFDVTVYGTDSRWNPAASTQTIRIITDDPYDPEPPVQELVDGYGVFVTTLVTANAGALNPANRNTVITAQDVTPVTACLTQGTVQAPAQPDNANASYLQLLVPGETHRPGNPPYAGAGAGGKSGAPSVLTAGSNYSVTVNACDQYWNISPSQAPLVKVVTSDPYDTEPASGGLASGSRAFTLNLRRATLYQGGSISSTTVRAGHDDVSPQYIAAASTVSVSPENLGKSLLVLVPSQQHVAGSGSGKSTASTLARTAGTPFTATVHCVDTFNNIVPSANPLVRFTSTDPNDGAASETGVGWDPLDQPLENGSTVFMVTLVSGNSTYYLTAQDNDGVAPYYGQVNSDTIQVDPAPAVKLQVLLPGETGRPNTASGRTGTPATQTAGAPFDVTVNCTDMFWNVNAASNPYVSVRTDDLYDVEPSTAYLASGTGTFTLTLLTATTSHLVTALDADSVFTTGISSTFTVAAASAYRVHVIVPGESFDPGKPPYDGTSGKTGTPLNQTAGAAFTITVRGTDQYYNLRNDMTGLVNIVTSDPFDNAVVSRNLVQGEVTFNATLVTYSSQTVTASRSGVLLSTSSLVYVRPNTFTRVQILVPGETAQPGNQATRGRSGTPSVQTAGAAFFATVNACDSYFNQTPDQPAVTVTTSDEYDTEPGSKNLINGTTVFSLTLVTARVSSATVTSAGYVSDYSGNITVQPNSPYRLQVLVPGETPVSGKYAADPRGKTGAPAQQYAGSSFDITVRSVDNWWNLTSSTPEVTLESSDQFDFEPVPARLVNGSQTFNWTLYTANAYQVIAASHSLTDTLVTPAQLTAVSTTVWVNANGPVKLLAMLPGESHAPGSPTGKNGTPSARTAGISFLTTVYGCDAYWNYVPSETSLIHMVTTDNFGNAPADQALNQGQIVFNNTLYTASTHTITLNDLDAPSMASYVTPQFTVVSSDAVKLQALLPGETALPGKPPYASAGGGKAGTPSARTAGTPFAATVRAVDPYWNLVTGDVSFIHVVTEDSYDTDPADAALVGGTANFTLTMVTASTWTVTATDTDGSPALAVCVSSPVYVQPAAPVKLQVLLPGETARPGASLGKTGTVSAQTAGAGFNATVNLCDDYWNRILSGAMPTVTLGATDVFWSTPAARPLVNGTFIFNSAVLYTASTHTLTASGGAYQLGVSSPVVVNPSSATQLLVVLPGETQVNGKINGTLGRSGTPQTQTAGQNFTPTVYAVDAYYNYVNSESRTVTVTTSDSYDTDPNNGAGMSMTSGLLTAVCQLHTAQPATVTASAAGLTAHQSSNVNVIPALPVKLQVLVPGEYAIPGFGRGGSPENVQAGVSFDATVRSCDDFWNLSYAEPLVDVWTTDPNDSDPSWSGIITGSGTVSITMVTASTGTSTFAVYAADGDGLAPNLLTHNSQGIRVLPGVPAKLFALLDGESFAGGTPSGKTGTPTVQTAGTPFNVQVALCDNYWNPVPNASVIVRATSPQDPYDVEPSTDSIDTASGTQMFTFNLHKAATYHTIYLEDMDEITPLYGVNTSSLFSCDPQNDIAKLQLQLLLPGESSQPGSSAGKTGAPSARTAGAVFQATVNLVDEFNNLNGTAVQPEVHLDTTDNYDVEPSTEALLSGSGSRIFDVTLFTAATTHVVIARDITSVYPSDASPQLAVNAAAAERLHVIVPGESLVPAKAPYDGTGGRTGTPETRLAGQSLNVTVYLTDHYYNRIRTEVPMPAAGVRTWDAIDVEPSTRTLSNGMYVFMTNPLFASSTWTATAYDPALAYSSGTSSNIRVWPAPVHYFALADYPGSVTAGSAFNVRVNAFDQYRNAVSTGPSWDQFASYSRSVRFEAQSYPSPQNATIPVDYDFVAADYGTRVFPGVVLRKAGSRTLRAYDTWDTSIASNRSGFSTLSTVTVNPGEFYKIAVSTDSLNPGTPAGNMEVDAGSLSDPGRRNIIGQMVD
ncbi:MAG: RHS repeat domain-containing protein, partial [Endomicrobiales bacterium]